MEPEKGSAGMSRRRRAGAVAAAVLVLGACSGPPEAARPAPAGEASAMGEGEEPRLEARAYRSPLTGGERKYWIRFPRGYATKDRWPLILFLHGMGERGDDLDRALIHGVVKEAAKKGRDLPFVVLGPLCPKLEAGGDPPTMWDAMEADLVVILDETLARERIDADRVHLTGLSMGGFGTWHFGSRHAGRFASLAPVCGWGDPAWTAALRDKPVWAFHGMKDPVVPPVRSIEMVGELKKVSPGARLTTYPELAHNCWDAVYGADAIYDWFLDHRRRR